VGGAFFFVALFLMRTFGGRIESRTMTTTTTMSLHVCRRPLAMTGAKGVERKGGRERARRMASSSSSSSFTRPRGSFSGCDEPRGDDVFWVTRRRRRRRKGRTKARTTATNASSTSATTTQKTLFGVPMTPETSAIALVYFVQGVVGLAALAKSFFLKDELHLSPSEAAVVTSVSSLPWLVKPLWGFISDTIPLFGYKRKSYLCLMGVLGCVAWSTLSQGVAVVDNRWTASFLFAIGALSIAFSDVLIDSIVVERARESEDKSTTGSLQSLCWGMVAFGGIASSYFSGELVEEKGSAFVFACTAVFPLMIAGAAFLVKEERKNTEVAVIAGSEETKAFEMEHNNNGSVMEAGKETLSTLWSVVRQKQIWGPALFMYLWQATPSPGSAMFYFSTNELHFSPEFLGRVSFARSLAALGGVGLYNAYFKYVPLKKMFTYSAILATALGSTQLLLVSGYNRELGISDELFALTDSAVLTVLGEISFLPVLVLAAKICPKGVEATLFASLMSLFNFGGVTSQFLGAGLTEKLGVTADNFDHLFELVAICNFTTLLPLVAIEFLNDVEEREEDDGADSDDEGNEIVQA
jgi:folate/biopterin transporter